MRRPVSGRDAVRSQVIDVLEAQIKRRPAMKKVSTVAVRASRKISSQKLTVGLDLGDRSSWYCVLDEAGSVLLEQRLSTTSKALREVFGGMPRSRIALETGMHSPWVSRLLSELGHEVIVAHARANGRVATVGGSARKKQRDQQRPKQSDLTPTGLLMEGHYTQNPSRARFAPTHALSRAPCPTRGRA